MAGENEGQEQGTEQKAPGDRMSAKIAELREKVDAGESVFTPEAAAELSSTREAQERAAAKAAKAEEKPAGGEEEPTGEEPTGEEEAAAGEAEEGGEATEEAEAGAEAAETEEEEPTGEEEKTPPEGEDITVMLPGRNDGEEVEFVVDDVDTADTLRRLRKGYLRGEQMEAREAKVREAWEEIDEIDERLQTDPLSFFNEKTPKEHKINLVTELLLDDDVFQGVQDQLDEIEDPEKREVLRLRAEKKRNELRESSQEKLARRRAARKAVQKIGDTIREFVPQGMDPERSARFQVAAMNVAEDLAGQLKTLDLSRDQLVTALDKEGLLDRFGVDPTAAPGSSGKNGKSAGNRSGAESPPSKKKKAAGKDAARTAEGLKKASLRRKSVAGSASSGAGAPTATVELERTPSVKDRINEVRKKGLGAVLQGK